LGKTWLLKSKGPKTTLGKKPREANVRSIGKNFGQGTNSLTLEGRKGRGGRQKKRRNFKNRVKGKKKNVGDAKKGGRDQNQKVKKKKKKRGSLSFAPER